MAFSQQTQADFTAQRYKVLHDPIHKYMTLDDSVLDVIDTPQFQRLRELKQACGRSRSCAVCGCERGCR